MWLSIVAYPIEQLKQNIQKYYNNLRESRNEGEKKKTYETTRKSTAR